MTGAEMRTDVFRDQLERAFDGEPSMPPASSYEQAGRRRMRRTRSAIVAGFSIVAVAGPIAAVAIADRIGEGESVPVAAADPKVPGDWRAEAGAGVTFFVPPEWVVGDQSQWCIRGVASPPPLVFIAGEMAQTQVACASPVYWYGATLAPADSEVTEISSISSAVVKYEPAPGDNQPDFPAGAWVTRVEAPNGWMLTVVAPDRETAETIVSSVRSSADDEDW
ncbi:hypothetical protein GCM10027062_35680 [Nocardioides hungaricus]